MKNSLNFAPRTINFGPHTVNSAPYKNSAPRGAKNGERAGAAKNDPALRQGGFFANVRAPGDTADLQWGSCEPSSAANMQWGVCNSGGAAGDLQKRFARQRGATIGYAVVFMVIVTAFIALVLALGTQSVKLSDRYRNYTDEKLLLDEIGASAIANFQGKTEAETAEAEDLSAAFAERLPAGWTIGEQTSASSAETAATHTVTVKKGDGVRLLVRFTADDGTYTLTAYTYGE